MTPLLAIYLFCAVVGGVFVALSALGGLSKSVELDKNVDADADAALDFDKHVDFDKHLDFDKSLHTGELSASQGAQALKDFDTSRGKRFRPLLSFKFWTFCLAFFGVTGTIFTLLNLIPSPLITLIVSVMTGVTSGLGVSYALFVAGRSVGGRNIGDDDFRGIEGKVVVPFDHSRRGRVLVVMKGSLVEVDAVSLDPDDHVVFDFDQECLVVDIKDGIAQVVHSPTGSSP